MAKRKKKQRRRRTPGVAYQNKDIIAKIFGETMREKSLKVYGIDVPDVAGVEPTELPSVEVTALRADNVFLLKDGSYAIIDYESEYRAANKIKYIGYILRTVKRLVKAGMKITDIKIHMIVIYTADVKEGQTENMLDLDVMELYIEEAFLMGWNGEEIFEELKEVIEDGEELDEEDQMRLIILPLTFEGDEAKKAKAKEVIELAKKIGDEEVQRFVLAGIISFADKAVDHEDAEEVRRYLTMTKVGKIIYEEKLAYGKEVEAEEREKAILSLVSLCKRTKGTMKDVVENLMEDYDFKEDEAMAKVKALW